MPEDKYTSQKKYLAARKKLSVWFDAEEYETFKTAVAANGDTIYRLIHDFVEDYLKTRGAEE